MGNADQRMRSTITGGTEGLEIVIPARRNLFRFGAGIDEAEARMIVERMKQRYAFAETLATV